MHERVGSNPIWWAVGTLEPATRRRIMADISYNKLEAGFTATRNTQEGEEEAGAYTQGDSRRAEDELATHDQEMTTMRAPKAR